MKERKQAYFKKVGDSLPKIIDKNIKKKNFIEVSLINKWKEIVGVDIADLCYPLKVNFSNTKDSNGVIFLKTIRGKSIEIDFKGEEIMEKLNQYFGYKAIDKISIVQDFETKNKNPEKKLLKSKKLKNNHSKIVNKIKENEIKIALKKLDKTLFD